MLANYLKRSKSCSTKIRCILKLNLFQLVEGLRKHSSFLVHDKAAFSALRIICVCRLIASLCRVFFFRIYTKKCTHTEICKYSFILALKKAKTKTICSTQIIEVLLCCCYRSIIFLFEITSNTFFSRQKPFL